jgi:hypothetical protein
MWVTEYRLDSPGVIHVYQLQDEFKHAISRDGICWCGAWHEQVEGGTIVHHPNLTERYSKVSKAS